MMIYVHKQAILRVTILCAQDGGCTIEDILKEIIKLVNNRVICEVPWSGMKL